MDTGHYSSQAEPGYNVKDESDDRRYFTQIPNFILELEMSREAKWLYVHLKRTAGDSGRCYKSLNTLTKETQTSKPTLIKAKAELVKHGLIRVWPADRGDKADTITIRNVWRRNLDHFDGVVNLETTHPVNKETTPVKDETGAGKSENRKKNTQEEPNRKVLSGKGNFTPRGFEGYEYLLTD